MKFLRRLRDEGPLPVAPDDEAPKPTEAADTEDSRPEPEASEAGADEAKPAQGAEAEGVARAGAATPAEQAAESGLPAPAPVADEAETPLPAASDMAEGDPDVDASDAPRGADAARLETPAEAGPEVDAHAVPAAPERPQIVLASDASAVEASGDGRPADLQLAGLHLRTGLHALARAELEALAGRGRLDETALLDLAEVRWRTGDLAGAGDAANALLARGAESPLALVIAAEAVSAAGRPGEARRLSSRAVEAAAGPLDPIFAGMPQASIWPAPREPERRADEPPAARSRSAVTAGAPSTASEAFAGGRAALARGDATRAALLLGVAMRLAPEFAEDVLRAVAGRDDQPLLALVRGDALRLLGREAEALEAFDRARGRPATPEASSRPGPGGPGLFDDDAGAPSGD